MSSHTKLAVHRAEADRVSRLLEYSPAAIATLDHSGKVLSFSPSFTRIFGYTVNDIPHIDAWWPLAYPDPAYREDRRSTWMALTAEMIAADSEIHNFEGHVCCKDGHHRWVEAHSSFSASEIFIMLVDISSRKQAEQQQQQYEEEFSGLMDAIFDGVGIHKDGTLRYVNLALAEMFGMPREAVIGRSGYDFWLPEYHEQLKEIGRNSDAQTCVDVEFRTPDGRITPCQIRGKPYNYRGEEVRLFSVRDLSIDRAFTAFRQQAEQLRVLSQAITQSPSSIIVTDPHARITYVNDGFCTITGYSRDEVVGQSANMLGAATTPPETLSALTTALAAGRAWKGEFHNRRRDGRIGIDDCDIAPVFDDQGHLTHFVAVQEDITEKKKTALELEQHRKYLEEMVTARTTELSTAIEELKEARSAAEQLAHIKSQFLANMSHEIRTPLNGVLGLAQIGYRENAGRSKAQEGFARILDSGKLLLNVINDILDFSKIEAGKLAIESVPYAPRQVIDSTLAVIAERATAKGLSVTTRIDAQLPPACRGDPTRIAQVLLNFLSNAIKFTASGSITLTAGCEGDSLILAVADTGIGMVPEQLARLYAPFEQADTSTTRRYGGTGLGLSISKRLVELMAGEIHVTSTPGVGTRFALHLPYVAADPDELAREEQNWPALGTANRLAGVRILAAEDNEVNQWVLTHMLESEGAELTLVSNGQLAVNAVGKSPAAFDLVLMDVQMPVMDGLEATRRIATLAPTLPVVGQTAHALAEERTSCLSAGMVDTLTKPLEHECLVSMVRRHARGVIAASASMTNPVSPSPAIGAPSTAPELIDWTQLRTRYIQRPDFLEKLIRIALDSQSETAQAIHAAVLANDTQKLRQLAHSIRGMAGNICAKPLLDCAHATEMAARDGLAEASALGERLASMLDQCMKQFQQELDCHHTGSTGNA
jgi:PAS domain S-box-containing protein